jgi:hypothetical protein
MVNTDLKSAQQALRAFGALVGTPTSSSGSWKTTPRGISQGDQMTQQDEGSSTPRRARHRVV